MWAHYIDSWANFSLLPTKEKDAKETTLTISNVLILTSYLYRIGDRLTV